MCGILGKLSFAGRHETPAQFAYALEQLKHRGPDDRGTHHETARNGCRVSLGQTRLSILDLSPAGHQPMFSRKTGVATVYNGEVYNFREIRDRLRKQGHEFRSECDTEVILAAYDEFGANCLEELVGMFAIAILDQKGEQLLLARDRLGIKPLYYYWDGNQLAFASELVALSALPTLNLELSREAVHHLLVYGYIPRELSIFKHVSKLLPGHSAILDLTDRKLRVRAYWDALEFYETPAEFNNEAEVLDAVRSELQLAVKRRLISDVPLGAFLSGGIDSSLVVALMQKASSTPVKTFTIGFSETSFDEAPMARRVAEHLGTEHQELYIDEQSVLEIARTASDYYDEPFGDTSSVPTLALSRMTRQHVTVALSGDGGDELFWGYNNYSPGGYVQYDRFKRIPASLRRLAGATMQNIPRSRISEWGSQLQFSDFAEYFLRKFQLATRVHYPRLLVDPALENDRVIDSNRTVLSRTDHRGRDVVVGAMDVHNYLPDDILTKVDRASMSVGLEVRVPILDHNVVQLAARIPSTIRTRGGELKYLLKKLLSEHIPSDLWERPKKGFGVPVSAWMRTSLKEWISDEIASENSHLYAFVDRSQLREVLDDHLAERRDNKSLLWACVQFVGWERRIRSIRSEIPESAQATG